MRIVIILLIMASVIPTSSFAQAPKPRPALTGDIGADIQAARGAPQAVGKNLLDALDDKLLPDLIYAKKIADATGSNVTAPCYQAWIDIIQKRKTAVINADGTPMDLPQPRLITDFEKAIELRNALQPDSEFMIRCAPVANMIKTDVIAFIGKILVGGAGLAALGL